MRFHLTPLLISALLITTGCTSLRELKETEITGHDFLSALAAEYLNYAESESEQFDWVDAEHFAEKGLDATKGKYPEPEQVEKWDVPPDAATELEAARSLLMNVLTEDRKQKHPLQTARAQLLFDCWIEQQEEIWQSGDIATCREAFTLSIELLTSGEDLAALEQDDESDNGFGLSALPDFIKRHVVFFDYDRASITPDTQEVVGGISTFVKDVRNIIIHLTGHADRAGKERYNALLARLRAQSVKVEFMKQGIDKHRIMIHSKGEAEPAIATADDASEPRNRRVEIDILEGHVQAMHSTSR